MTFCALPIRNTTEKMVGINALTAEINRLIASGKKMESIPYQMILKSFQGNTKMGISLYEGYSNCLRHALMTYQPQSSDEKTAIENLLVDTTKMHSLSMANCLF